MTYIRVLDGTEDGIIVLPSADVRITSAGPFWKHYCSICGLSWLNDIAEPKQCPICIGQWGGGGQSNEDSF
jgi:rubrerythrin